MPTKGQQWLNSPQGDADELKGGDYSQKHDGAPRRSSRTTTLQGQSSMARSTRRRSGRLEELSTPRKYDGEISNHQLSVAEQVETSMSLRSGAHSDKEEPLPTPIKGDAGHKSRLSLAMEQGETSGKLKSKKVSEKAGTYHDAQQKHHPSFAAEEQETGMVRRSRRLSGRVRSTPTKYDAEPEGHLSRYSTPPKGQLPISETPTQKSKQKGQNYSGSMKKRLSPRKHGTSHAEHPSVPATVHLSNPVHQLAEPTDRYSSSSPGSTLVPSSSNTVTTGFVPQHRSTPLITVMTPKTQHDRAQLWVGTLGKSRLDTVGATGRKQISPIFQAHPKEHITVRGNSISPDLVTATTASNKNSISPAVEVQSRADWSNLGKRVRREQEKDPIAQRDGTRNKSPQKVVTFVGMKTHIASEAIPRSPRPSPKGNASASAAQDQAGGDSWQKLASTVSKRVPTESDAKSKRAAEEPHAHRGIKFGLHFYEGKNFDRTRSDITGLDVCLSIAENAVAQQRLVDFKAHQWLHARYISKDSANYPLNFAMSFTTYDSMACELCHVYHCHRACFVLNVK